MTDYTGFGLIISPECAHLASYFTSAIANFRNKYDVVENGKCKIQDFGIEGALTVSMQKIFNYKNVFMCEFTGEFIPNPALQNNLPAVKITESENIIFWNKFMDKNSAKVLQKKLPPGFILTKFNNYRYEILGEDKNIVIKSEVKAEMPYTTQI